MGGTGGERGRTDTTSTTQADQDTQAAPQPQAPQAPQRERRMTSQFGEWLDAAVAAKGWDMATLADRAGIARSTLSMLRPPSERTPSPATCRKLARALGVPETLVLEIAGHIQPQDVSRSIHAVTGQAILEHRDPETGETSTMQLPARILPVDAVELAKLAVHNISPDVLSEESKWRVSQLIDALTNAQRLEEPAGGTAGGTAGDTDRAIPSGSGELPRLPPAERK